MPQFIISFEGDYPKVFDIDKDEITIGRHSENDIRLPFDFISSFHAKLIREPSGEYRLTDCDSHNGTKVNGNNLGSALLEDGDQVSFGGLRAAFRAGARKTAEPEPQPQPQPQPQPKSKSKSKPKSIEMKSEGEETAAPKTQKLKPAPSGIFSLDGPPLQETAPIAIPRPGAIQSLSEVELQAQLRDKVQNEIAREFEDEKKLIDDLKAISAELEVKNAEARDNLSDAEDRAAKAERAAANHQSDMAMREHMVRDLEKARVTEEEKLAKAEALRDVAERDHRILSHELVVGTKDLDLIKKQIAENKAASEKIENAFKKVIEYEAKAVRIDTEIVEKEKNLSDLARTLSEKQESLVKTERALVEKRREIEEVGDVRLVDLKSEIEELEKGIEGKKKELESLDAEKGKAEKLVGELKSQVDEDGNRVEEARRMREGQERELDECRSRLEGVLRELEENSSRNKALIEERKRIQEEIANARKEGAELSGQIDEKKKAAQLSEEERGKVEEFQARCKQLEVDLAARKEQLSSVDTNLASKRRALSEVEKSLESGRAELEEVSSVRLVKLRSEAEETQKATSDSRSRLDEVRKELAAMEKTREEHGSALAEKADELRKLKDNCEKRAAELAELEAKKDSVRKEREAAGGALEETIGELEVTKVQLDDQKKVARKIANELRTLEEHKSENAQLEDSIRESKSQIKKLDEQIAGQQKSLRQVEKELASRQKSLRKSGIKDRFKFAGAFGGDKKNGRDEPSQDEKPKEENAKPASEKGSASAVPAAESEVEAEAKRVELEKENRRISQLIAEKTAALQKLEEEIAVKQAGDREDSKETGKTGSEKRIDLSRGTGGLRKPSSDLKELAPKPDQDAVRGAGKGGIALLNTGSDARSSNEKAAPPADSIAMKVEPKETKSAPAADKSVGQEKGSSDKGKESDASADAPAAADTPPAKPKPVPLPVSRKSESRSGNGNGQLPSTSSGVGEMEDDGIDIVPLRVIHPRTREMIQYYPEGAGSFDPQRHPPVGFHALAASTKGSVHRTVESLPSGDFAALILLNGSLEKDREIIQHVSREIKDKPLLACWREGRLDKLAAQLSGGSDFQQFTDMLGAVDGLISTDARTSSLLDELHVARRYIELPLPYPIDAESWDFSVPIPERTEAIFVSGDGFDPGSEEHKARIELVNTLADKHRLKVTVYHHLPDILSDLNVPADLLSEPSKTLSYGEYLSMMARHRFVVGFGNNMAGSEIFGDALLTRNVYLGAHGALESLLFPETSFADNSDSEILGQVGKLLDDSSAFEESIAETRRRALGKISFKTARARLGEFLGTISQELLTIG